MCMRVCTCMCLRSHRSGLERSRKEYVVQVHSLVPISYAFVCNLCKWRIRVHVYVLEVRCALELRRALVRMCVVACTWSAHPSWG